MRLLRAFALAVVALPAVAGPCTAPLPPRGAEFAGTVRYIGDGDSLCVGRSADPRTWIEVRLADFFAPELHAPGGGAARAALARIARGRQSDCVAGDRSYDRIVAQCYVRGRSLGDLMREAGVQEGGRGR